MIYGKREVPQLANCPEKHTLAIGYKASEWVLIDSELIDFSDLAQMFPDLPEFKKPKQGMLCLF